VKSAPNLSVNYRIGLIAVDVFNDFMGVFIDHFFLMSLRPYLACLVVDLLDLMTSTSAAKTFSVGLYPFEAALHALTMLPRIESGPKRCNGGKRA
jgi:hypothetical protein